MNNGGAIFGPGGRLSLPPLLLIAGCDQDTHLIIGQEAIRTTGSSDLHLLIDQSIPYYLLHVTKNYFKQAPSRPDLLAFRTVLNLVTDPDQNPKVLANIHKLLRGFRGRILNRPEVVLRSTRDQVARALDGIPGLIVPKTIRLGRARPDVAARTLAKAGVRYPVLLRRAGTHTGEFIGRFETSDEAIRGLSPASDHIVTEFVEFAGTDGLYRKYRVFFVGDRIIFRHMLVSDHWNVHAKDRTRFMASRPDLLAEEQAVLCSPAGGLSDDSMNVLRRVRERIPLDYFGMDFAIAPDGKILLFEANPTMNFFPFLDDPRFAYVKQSLEPAGNAMHEMIGAPIRRSSSQENSFA